MEHSPKLHIWSHNFWIILHKLRYRIQCNRHSGSRPFNVAPLVILCKTFFQSFECCQSDRQHSGNYSAGWCELMGTVVTHIHWAKVKKNGIIGKDYERIVSDIFNMKNCYTYCEFDDVPMFSSDWKWFMQYSLWFKFWEKSVTRCEGRIGKLLKTWNLFHHQQELSA